MGSDVFACKRDPSQTDIDRKISIRRVNMEFKANDVEGDGK